MNSEQLSTVAFKNGLLFNCISRGSNVGYAKLMWHSEKAYLISNSNSKHGLFNLNELLRATCQPTIHSGHFQNPLANVNAKVSVHLSAITFAIEKSIQEYNTRVIYSHLRYKINLLKLAGVPRLSAWAFFFIISVPTTAHGWFFQGW